MTKIPNQEPEPLGEGFMSISRYDLNLRPLKIHVIWTRSKCHRSRKLFSNSTLVNTTSTPENTVIGEDQKITANLVAMTSSNTILQNEVLALELHI